MIFYQFWTSGEIFRLDGRRAHIGRRIRFHKSLFAVESSSPADGRQSGSANVTSGSIVETVLDDAVNGSAPSTRTAHMHEIDTQWRTLEACVAIAGTKM